MSIETLPQENQLTDQVRYMYGYDSDPEIYSQFEEQETHTITETLLQQLHYEDQQKTPRSAKW